MATGGSGAHGPAPSHTASVLPYQDILGPEDEDEKLDPRVKSELESLNQSASDVNRLEKEIDAAREKYQLTFNESSQRLEQVKKKIQGSIRKARPYFELREIAKEAQSEALRAARKFQAANGVYLAAKETISLAELRLMDDKAVSLSAAWQEMLNHALTRVTDAEKEKSHAEKEHMTLAEKFADMELKLHGLEKSQKKSISKARAYFETKKALEIKLRQLKQTLEDLQQAMRSAKRRYSASLRHLEDISDGIHEKRRRKLLMMLPREPGVGAEENSEELQDRGRLPSLTSSSFTDDSSNCLPSELDDELDAIDEEFLAYQDIQNESVFRAKVLSTPLDDDDVSFLDRGAFRERKKRLMRVQSLPMNIDENSEIRADYLFHHGADSAESFNCLKEVVSDRFGPCLSTDESLNSDRSENSPPDGDSLSNEKQYGSDSSLNNTTVYFKKDNRDNVSVDSNVPCEETVLKAGIETSGNEKPKPLPRMLWGINTLQQEAHSDSENEKINTDTLSLEYKNRSESKLESEAD